MGCQATVSILVPCTIGTVVALCSCLLAHELAPVRARISDAKVSTYFIDYLSVAAPAIGRRSANITRRMAEHLSVFPSLTRHLHRRRNGHGGPSRHRCGRARGLTRLVVLP